MLMTSASLQRCLKICRKCFTRHKSLQPGQACSLRHPSARLWVSTTGLHTTLWKAHKVPHWQGGTTRYVLWGSLPLLGMPTWSQPQGRGNSDRWPVPERSKDYSSQPPYRLAQKLNSILRFVKPKLDYIHPLDHALHKRVGPESGQSDEINGQKGISAPQTSNYLVFL